ncbi:MAG: GAF domain-containing protein [Burkholderiaceae bacterium]
MSASLSPVETLRVLSELGTQIADSANLNDVIQRLSEGADTLIGHRLFTVMAFDANNRQVRRIFSNQPAAYPAGGIKTKGQSDWAKQVLDEGKPYIGSNADDIRRHFADHELIASLGLASVLNMPVRVAGQTLGTMNLLNTANYYRPDHLALARVLAGLLGSSLLLHPSFE